MNILIVDDNIHHAELAAIRLREMNWNTTITTQHQLPDDLGQFDLVVTDYSMPGKDGLTVIQEILRNEPDMPVIMMTGYGNEHLAIEAIKRGAYDYIVKDTQLDYLKKLPIAIDEARKKYQLIQTNRMLINELKHANDKLQKLSMTDEVTGTHNTRYLSHELEKEIQRARRYQKSLSIAVIDVDHFKVINDRYGHPFGNYVLRTLASLLESEIRNVDFVTRYGGDEFIVAFPDTPLEAATTLCERIRRKIQTAAFQKEHHATAITVSMGLAAFQPETDMNHQSLISRADQNLYEAKNKGRNIIVSHWTPPPLPKEAPAPSRNRTDKRKSRRYPLHSLPLFWRLGASKYQPSIIQNISDSGVLFTSSKSLNISSIINLKIEIPNHKKPITGMSEVIHVQKKSGKAREYQIGIRFLNMHETDYRCLRAYLARHAQ